MHQVTEEGVTAFVYIDININGRSPDCDRRLLILEECDEGVIWIINS
jgi:hypothetical protein